jgi:hypothetical protein
VAAAGVLALVTTFGVALSQGWHKRRLPLPHNATPDAQSIAAALLDKPCDPALTRMLIQHVRDENGCVPVLPLVSYAEANCAAQTDVLEIGADCHLENADLDLARAEAKTLVMRDPASPEHRVRLARALERIGSKTAALHHYRAAARLLTDGSAPELVGRITRGLARCDEGSGLYGLASLSQ